MGNGKRGVLSEGDKHCLFVELYQAGFIHLQLTDVNFEATPTGIIVSIPVDDWEEMRQSSRSDAAKRWKVNNPWTEAVREEQKRAGEKIDEVGG